jgi:hypothetical protein
MPVRTTRYPEGRRAIAILDQNVLLAKNVSIFL